MTLFLVALLVAAAITVFILISDKPSDKSQLGTSGLSGDNVDAMLDNLKNETRRIEAFIQAGIVGDRLTANEFPYRCTAYIEACEDETDGHKFFVGYVYIKRLD